MAGLFSRNLREMKDSAMLRRKTNPIAAGIPLKTAKNLQITGNQLILTDIGGFSGGFVDFPFNGFDLTVVSGLGIQSAVADASSQFDPVGISIVGGDQLFLNYEGDSINPGWSSVIDYSTASVPDGGMTSLLLGGALFGLGLLRRKLA